MDIAVTMMITVVGCIPGTGSMTILPAMLAAASSATTACSLM
jgi:adenylate kinase